MIVAVTGYIGSGKSTTAQIMNHHGYAIVEVDLIGHELLEKNDLAEKLRAQFGIGILDRELNIDREKLSKIVFNDDLKLKKLNEIMHPTLKEEVQKRVEGSTENIVIDVALYTELDIDKLADRAILITTDVDKVYERLAPQYTKEEILNVMNNQILIKKPDHIIENNGTLQQLKSRVEQLLTTF